MASKKAIGKLLRELLVRFEEHEAAADVARTNLEATAPRKNENMNPVYPWWCSTVNQRADYRADKRKRIREHTEAAEALNVAITALERAAARKPAQKGR